VVTNVHECNDYFKMTRMNVHEGVQ